MTQRALHSPLGISTKPILTPPILSGRAWVNRKTFLTAQKANKFNFYRLSLAVRFVIEGISLTSSICHKFGDTNEQMPLELLWNYVRKGQRSQEQVRLGVGGAAVWYRMNDLISWGGPQTKINL